jgi:hypothetical protein
MSVDRREFLALGSAALLTGAAGQSAPLVVVLVTALGALGMAAIVG